MEARPEWISLIKLGRLARHDQVPEGDASACPSRNLGLLIFFFFMGTLLKDEVLKIMST